MKTTRFISVLVCLFISFNVMAIKNSPNVKILSNIEKTDAGHTKVLTSYNETTSTPISQTSYKYDNQGNILEKTIYRWNGNGSWTGSQKLEYKYNDNSEPTIVILTKWDNKTQTWSEKSEQMNYTYGNEGGVYVSVADN